MLYWSKESSGAYSVKSAYNFLQKQKGRWQVEDIHSIWKVIWKIKAPPKTLNLLWRALSGCLPTRYQLFLKHAQVDKICPVCNSKEESIFHALVMCPFAHQCWTIIFPSLQIGDAQDYGSWLSVRLKESNSSKCAEVATISWAIWRARNELVWNEKRTRVNNVVVLAKQYLLQWKYAQVNSICALPQTMMEGDGAISWARPQGTNIKVTVDSACLQKEKSTGWGWLLETQKGSWWRQKQKASTVW